MKYHQITDDSGLIALIDPDAYRTFVASDWDYDQLVTHFLSEMKALALLIWGTEMENIWKVAVAQERPTLEGFRQVTGFIRSTKGRLLLLSYDNLTYAAQFSDEHFPRLENAPDIIQLAPGLYKATIVQASDHDVPMSEFITPHYRIYLESVHTNDFFWEAIPWE